MYVFYFEDKPSRHLISFLEGKVVFVGKAFEGGIEEYQNFLDEKRSQKELESFQDLN